MKKIKKEPEMASDILPTTDTKPFIALLSVDYSSEPLNDMARKINEIISHLNNI